LENCVVLLQYVRNVRNLVGENEFGTLSSGVLAQVLCCVLLLLLLLLFLRPCRQLGRE
jgi:hypothetical protein